MYNYFYTETYYNLITSKYILTWLGSNNGEVAGQTIFHCHLHVIPRREDDVINATGGVRNIIPGKGDYIKAE